MWGHAWLRRDHHVLLCSGLLGTLWGGMTPHIWGVSNWDILGMHLGMSNWEQTIHMVVPFEVLREKEL